MNSTPCAGGDRTPGARSSDSIAMTANTTSPKAPTRRRWRVKEPVGSSADAYPSQVSGSTGCALISCRLINKTCMKSTSDQDLVPARR